jgi:dimethylaniline monooxygenase (N-oxide forming)
MPTSSTKGRKGKRRTSRSASRGKRQPSVTTAGGSVKLRRSPSRSRSPVAARHAAEGAAFPAAPAGGYLASPYTPVGPLREAVPVVFQLAKAATLLIGLWLAVGAATSAVAPLAASGWDVARGLAARSQLTWQDVGLGLLLALTVGAYRLDAAARRHAAQAQRSGVPGGFGQQRNVVVVGAGPSGLVAAKYLREAGHSVRIFEGDGDIGGTFRYRAYDHAVHVSSKYLTAFTDLRLGPEEEDHLPITRYLEYLDEYAQMFDLRPLIEFHTRVADVARRGPDARAAGQPEYAVSITRGGSGSGKNGGARAEVVDADAVIVCSGLHLSPLRQHIPGIESFKGELIHSVQYKHRSQLRDKTLLVSGSGETAMDVAYHAICPGGDEARSVTMSTKNGFLSTPSCLPGGLPLDIFITNLFECCYEHRWVERAHLKWNAATYGIRGAFWLFTGSSWGFNQWAGPKAEVKRGYHFINKSGRAMSAINEATKGARSSFPWNLCQPKVHRPIKLVGQIVSHEGNGTFTTACGARVEGIDMVVQATGYRQVFPFLRDRELNEKGDHPLPSERLIVDADEPHLCFLGFARPNVGAIPPLAEMQIMWWLQYVQGDVALPLRSPTYRLLSSGSNKVVSYGVDQYDRSHPKAKSDLFALISGTCLPLPPAWRFSAFPILLRVCSWPWCSACAVRVCCDVWWRRTNSGAYMHCLGRDFGGAPSVSWLAKHAGLKALIAYTMGQAFTPFFRMMGPYADDHSIHVSTTELFDTVRPCPSFLPCQAPIK